MRGKPYGIIVLLRADPQWLRANLLQDFHERRYARFAGSGRGDRVALCNQRIRVSSEELFIRGGNSGKFLARHWMSAKEYRTTGCSLKMLRRFFHDSLFRAARVGYQSRRRRVAFNLAKNIQGHGNGQCDVNQICPFQCRPQISGKSFIERAAYLGFAHNLRAVPPGNMNVVKIFAQRQRERTTNQPGSKNRHATNEMCSHEDESGDAPADRRSNNPQLSHQSSERGRFERLCAVGKRMLGIVVDFNQQSICACSNGGTRHRWNFVAASRSVQGIGPHRQMRKLLDHRNRGQIKSVARVRFKSSDSTLAQNYVVVSARQNIFGAEQQLLHRRGHSAFQQHRLAHFAERAQKVVVLHVACANLVDVNVAAHHFDLRRVHHFADGEQSEFIGCFAHQFQTWFAHSLKRVRRSTRLERSPAQNFCAGFRHVLCDGVNLFARFHRTRSGSDHNFGPADFYAASKIDNRAFRLELPAGKFERLRDAHDFAHAFQQFKIAMIEIAVHTHCAKYSVRSSRGTVHVKAVSDELVNYVLNLGIRCALLHNDYHGDYAVPFRLSADSLAEIFWRTQKRSAQRKLNSRITAAAAFRVDFSVRVFVHGDTLRGTRFVDDALEQTANRCIRERPAVIVLRIFKNFPFTVRLIERQIRLLLQLPDFQRALRALVQQLNQLAVDFIDAAAPIGKVHVATSPRRTLASRRESPLRPASFRERMRSASVVAAASIPAAFGFAVVAFSISETSAEPTAAASARPPRTETWPGSEMPKPTAMGSCVTLRARRSSAGRSSGRASLAPVTPVREIRYRNPEEHAAIFSRRSAVEVGAPRKTVSR